MINPNYKEKFRNSCKQLYELKEKYSTDESVVPGMDWDVYFYSSPAKNALSFDYSTEYASLITAGGSIENAWKKWVDDYKYLIDPVLKEMSDNIGLKK